MCFQTHNFPLRNPTERTTRFSSQDSGAEPRGKEAAVGEEGEEGNSFTKEQINRLLPRVKQTQTELEQYPHCSVTPEIFAKH
jgi:hypothetical protein